MAKEFSNIYRELTHPTMTPIEAPQREEEAATIMPPVQEETPETTLVPSEGTIPTESRGPTPVPMIEE